MVCKLCLKEKTLIKKSHIIPSFMYAGMFNEQHHAFTFPVSESGHIEKKSVQKRSDGEYEGQILCSECDNKLLGHYYEDYASKVLYGGILQNAPVFNKVKSLEGVEFVSCKNIDYEKFKLFLLSIVWRAGISTRNLFSEIRLTSTKAEDIRAMILKKIPGPSSKYPCQIFSFRNHIGVKDKFILQPRHFYMKGVAFYSFLVGGFIYQFYINDDDQPIPSATKANCINERGEMAIQLLSKSEAELLIAAHLGFKNLPPLLR